MGRDFIGSAALIATLAKGAQARITWFLGQPGATRSDEMKAFACKATPAAA